MPNALEKNRAELLLEALRAAQDDLSEESVSNDMKKTHVYNTSQIFRIVRRELLARPPCRRLRPWPDPKLEGPFVISRAALKCRPSSRLNYLAEPKKDFYCELNDFQSISEDSYEKRNKPDFTRLTQLSKPRPLLDKEDSVKQSRFENRDQWFAYLKKLRKFAAARRTPPSALEPERVKKSLQTILPRLEQLSKPAYRPPNNNEWTHEELYTIKNAVLKYAASDRIKKLSVPKQLNEETTMNLTYDPNAKIVNAIKYNATERIKELAMPIVKTTPKEADIKTDAFKVNPKALKARCSPRIKKLAKPILRTN